jgi:hypothetical protein
MRIKTILSMTLFSLCSVAAAGDYWSHPDFRFKDTGEGTAAVTGYVGTGRDVSIPATVTRTITDSKDEVTEVRQYTVTSIDARAFIGDCHTVGSETAAGPPAATAGEEDAYECNILRSVIIPGSVTVIGECAFYECSNLASVTIPSSVTTIGDRAFYECRSLSSITLPHAVTTIGDGVFYNCSALTSVDIPNLVTTIGKSAFGGCRGLTSVTIPASVTMIDEGAFGSCTGLTSVAIPASVTHLDSRAFISCSRLVAIHVDTANPVYASDGNILYNKDKTVLLAYPAGKGGHPFVVPTGVTGIGEYAFSGCSALTSVIIGNSVTAIGNWAFSGCSALTSAVIGHSVTAIGNWAFSDCSVLTSVDIPSSVTSIGNGSFTNCRALTSIDIPSSVTTIGYIAFSGCSSLTSVTIPHSVTTVDHHAFYYCSALTSVDIPSSITTIEEGVFDGCRSLTSVTIPASVTTIRNGAFGGCSTLTSVTIPASVTAIGYNAFFNCSLLAAIHVNTGNPAYASDDGVLYNEDKTMLLTYPLGKGGKSFAIPTTVTGISSFAFMDCSDLMSVAIPGSVTWIGDCAFIRCRGLKDVYVEWEIPIDVQHNIFMDVDVASCILHVPAGRTIAYRATGVWKDFYTIRDDAPDANTPVEATEEVHCSGGVLSVRTPADESVTVYSPNGASVFRARKAPGEATFRLNHLSGGVYIVTGGSGWVRKIIK